MAAETESTAADAGAASSASHSQKSAPALPAQLSTIPVSYIRSNNTSPACVTSLFSDTILISQTDQMKQGSMRTPIFFSPPGGCYVDEDIDLFLSPRWMLRIAYT